MEKPVVQLSVIVPIFNEENSLMDMARGLADHLDRAAGLGCWQFVMIDNGSTDQTPSIINEIKNEWPTSISVRLARPDYGEALYHGLMKAEGDYAWIINVDFWDPLFIKWAWSARLRYDIIIGSKRADPTLNRQPKYRRTLSWGLNSILHLLFGFFGTDTHGQKLLKLESMKPVFKQCVMRRGQFDTEFTLKAQRQGMKIAEVPVPIVEERRQRNLMLTKIYRNLVDITRLKREMRKYPLNSSIHYHMWSRQDMGTIDYDNDSKE